MQSKTITKKQDLQDEGDKGNCMSKFKFKNGDCYLDNEDLDDIRESTRSESKQKKQKKKIAREQDFYSTYNPDKQKKHSW